jgi:hypothetical protein
VEKTMTRTPIRILLQTTITPAADDWSIARFSALANLLAGATDNGRPLFQVTARDRGPVDAPDPVMATLDTRTFDQVWLFAVDGGEGLTREDCAAITRFRARGGGLMLTRDHMDLGSSLCALGGVGAAHYFHSHNPPPDPARRVRDDPYTTTISWPNFHSGANGDYQAIAPVGPLHPVLADPASQTGAIRYLPAHPHEGGVLAPDGADARIIATGVSQATGRTFNIAVAFERGAEGGRALAQSTFHHFADYNWDPRAGSPSFVTEAPGEGLATHPQALRDTHRYALNLARWLGRATDPVEADLR